MSEQQQIESAKPGDLIEVFRPGYQHWAVYIGDEEVVHLCNPNSSSSSSMPTFSSGSRAVVKRQRIQEVTNGDKWRINNLLDKEGKWKPREPYIIVKEAISRVGDVLQYSVADGNCEHFVTTLRYGKGVSLQVLKTVLKVAALASVAIVSAPAAIAASAGALVASAFSFFRPRSS